MAQNWSFRAAATKDQTGPGGTSIVINKPANTADSDLLVASIQSNAADTHTGPAGWTKIREDTSAGNQKASVWRKIAASEGASWTWTVQAGGNLWIGTVLAYTGIDTSTPSDVDSGQNSNSSTATSPSVTTTATDDLDARVYQTWTTNSVTLDGSLSSRVNFGTNGSSIAVGDRNQATAAATGALNATLGANSAWIGQTATFKQTAGGGPSTFLVDLIGCGLVPFPR